MVADGVTADGITLDISAANGSTVDISATGVKQRVVARGIVARHVIAAGSSAAGSSDVVALIWNNSCYVDLKLIIIIILSICDINTSTDDVGPESSPPVEGRGVHGD